MPVFTASRISNNGNVLYPDAIAIDDYNDTYYKGRPVGYETTIIPRRCINGVYLDSHIFFADVVISSAGHETISAHGFKKSIAREIVKILTQ